MRAAAGGEGANPLPAPSMDVGVRLVHLTALPAPERKSSMVSGLAGQLQAWL